MLDFETTSITNKFDHETMSANTLFHIIDTDNKGFITQEDIRNAPKLIPADILKLINFNKSEQINLKEFEIIYENLNDLAYDKRHHSNDDEEEGEEDDEEVEEEEEEDFDKIFQLYSNRDFITREDILRENLNISHEMFNKLDLDGDGKLTYAEYQLASNMNSQQLVIFF